MTEICYQMPIRRSRLHVGARDIADFASPKATLDCVDAFGATDFRPDLAKFSIPTLVIHGDSDAIVPFEASGSAPTRPSTAASSS